MKTATPSPIAVLVDDGIEEPFADSLESFKIVIFIELAQSASDVLALGQEFGSNALEQDRRIIRRRGWVGWFVFPVPYLLGFLGCIRLYY